MLVQNIQTHIMGEGDVIVFLEIFSARTLFNLVAPCNLFVGTEGSPDTMNHFSPDASECEMTSQAYSLADGNWPEGSVSLRHLLHYSKLGRRSGLHLGALSGAQGVSL